MRPDAIVLDLVFAGTITLNTITSCREAAAQTAIVVFSSLPSRLYEQQALDAGADAYVTKENDLSGLVDVLDAIVSSGSAGTRGVAEPRAGAGQQLLLGDVYFTPREVEVGHLLSRGYSISRIADEIGVSSNTVAAHRDNIRRKLDCRDTGELIARLARIFEAPRSQ
jgi:DNA-binding NarL/FixJ family response regulator